MIYLGINQVCWYRKVTQFTGNLNISGNHLFKHRNTSSSNKEPDHFGRFVCLYVQFWFFITFLGAVSGVWNNLDPFYFVLEEYILPEAYNRSATVTVITIIVRLILCTLCGLEFGRFAAATFCVLVATLLCSLSIINKIFVVSARTAYRNYIVVQVAFAHARIFVNLGVGAIVFVGHIIIVGLAWLAIDCFSLLPVDIYVAIILWIVVVFPGYILMLTYIARIPVLSKIFLQTKMNTVYNTALPNRRDLLYKQFRAQRTVEVDCMSFFPLYENLVPVTLDHLSSDIVDAIVLF